MTTNISSCKLITNIWHIDLNLLLPDHFISVTADEIITKQSVKSVTLEVTSFH